MSDVLPFSVGGYCYLKGVFQYSTDVAAEPGFEIHRTRLARPLVLEEGYVAIEAHLRALGRPIFALCVCELRSSAPFTDSGFAAFNRDYVRQLERLGIFRDGLNPVARTNVCPEIAPPIKPSLYAFSYTVPAVGSSNGGFVIAGSSEASAATSDSNRQVTRPGDRTPDGMREKARVVLLELERRMALIGLGWESVSATSVYTVYNVHPLLGEIVARNAAPAGMTWHFARPPVQGLDYEMDVRGVAREPVLHQRN